MRMNVCAVVRVLILAVAITAIANGWELWLQYVLNMFSPLVWYITARTEVGRKENI